MIIEASAPGKVVLMGEYAVLEGAPAVVMAVTRRVQVRASLAESPDPTSPEDLESAWGPALAALRARGCEVSPATVVEASSAALYEDASGTSYGLGSSAAVTVAIMGALQRLGGQEATPTLEACIEAHDALQQERGSGIDVAAALAGGLLTYRLGDDGPSVAPLSMPADLEVRVVWTKRKTSTPAYLETLRDWAKRESAVYGERIEDMTRIATAFGVALAMQQTGTALAAVDQYADALAGLGRAAGIEIESAAHADLRALAAQHGAVYKSSGAGGGDVGVMFGQDASALADACDAATNAGYRVLDLRLDPDGLIVRALEEKQR